MSAVLQLVSSIDVQPPNKVLDLPSALEIVAVTTGALSGSLHATRKGLDPLGVIVVAICTGLGGGAIRDVLLNSSIPVFLVSPTLLWNAVLAAIIVTLFARPLSRLSPVMYIVDSLLIGVWVTIGVQKSLVVELAPVAAAFVGVVACTGGSLLRDLLIRDTPEVLQPGEFFAAAALAGSFAYLAVAAMDWPVWASVLATLVVATGLRGLSRWRHWETPAPPAIDPTPEPSG